MRTSALSPFGARKDLRYINIPMLLKVVGWLLMIESVFMLLPAVACLLWQESDFGVFLISAMVTALFGAVMTFGIKPRTTSMGKREGFLLTALVWVVFSIFGMMPFVFSSTPLSPCDAFFETMSGFTTTGASIYPDVEALSHGVNLWRCLTQWIGGMGIILFTLAVLPMLNHSGGMQMFNAEVTGITREKLRPRISQTAKGLWAVYGILTLLLAILLWVGPFNMFDAVCHALSTMSTGGFSTSNSSIAAWQSPYVKMVLVLFMFLGGVNFSLIFKASKGDVRGLWGNDSFRLYVKIIVVAVIIFSISHAISGIWRNSSGDYLILDPLFQVVSTISSTGLTISTFNDWGTVVPMLMMFLMFFGACAGSTSGGAKIDRLLYLIRNCKGELYRSIHPNSIRSVRINGIVMPSETVNRVMTFLCLYAGVITIGGCIVALTGIPAGDALFSAFSCVSNTGLDASTTAASSYGASTVSAAYATMPALAKLTLTALMLIGRLELFTVLILLTPSFWKK